MGEEFGSKEAGKKGGKARAEKLSGDQRSDIARRGAIARWEKEGGTIPKATHGSDDHPLIVGGIEIPCYVLDDGTRVITHRGLQGSLDMSVRGGATETAKFVQQFADKGVDCKDLVARLSKPIEFRPLRGRTAFGYEATVLADICEVLLEARRQDLLSKKGEAIANRCEILVRGFAKVGIIALVDEATGYQEARTKDALAKILEAFIDKELREWIQTFPADFYKQLFRLRGLDFPNDTVKRPQYFGVLTNDIVYKRIAPGVLEELKRVTPKDDSGRRKHKYFQRLTSNVGYPKLKEHLGGVVAIMKLSDSWEDFMSKLNRLYPRFGETLMLPFSDEDDGHGL